ncbi:MAG: hypothetical protein P8K27_04565 [Gammaproteobacteria bacterium]|nr:hypothetical protein [Gammaproteobacteria bacterium]
MIKLYLSLSVLLGINIWAILSGTSLANFINYPGIAVVLVPGSLYAVAGTKELKLRVCKFSDGAVLGGWIGTLIGAIMILGNSDFNNWQENIPPASAIMLLTVFYGYLVKAMCFLIAENLPEIKGE